METKTFNWNEIANHIYISFFLDDWRLVDTLTKHLHTWYRLNKTLTNSQFIDRSQDDSDDDDDDDDEIIETEEELRK